MQPRALITLIVTTLVLSVGILIWNTRTINGALPMPQDLGGTVVQDGGASAKVPLSPGEVRVQADARSEVRAGTTDVSASRMGNTENQSGPALRVRCLTDENEVLGGCRLALRAARTSRAARGELFQLPEVEVGVYVLRGLAAGRYDLLCRLPFFDEPVRAVSWDGKRDKELVLHVASRADLLGGKVQFTSGEPVGGAIVTSLTKTTREIFCPTDDDGRFLFRRVDSESTTATFGLLDRTGDAGIADRLAPLEISWGDLNHFISAEPRASVAVRLSDSSGRPIPDFTVRAESGRSRQKITRRGSAREGVAFVDNVPTGKAHVVVVPGPQWLPVSSLVDVASDGEGAVHLVARDAVQLRGSVASTVGSIPDDEIIAIVEELPAGISGNDGNHPAGAIVLAQGTRPDMRIQQAVVDGQFVFGCDPLVSYRLQVHAPGHTPFEQVVHSAGGQFEAVKVLLHSHHTWRARVTPAAAVDWLRRYGEQRVRAKGISHSFMLLQRDPVKGQKRLILRASPVEGGGIEISGISSGGWQLRLICPVGGSRLGEIEFGDAQVVDYPPIDLEHLRPGRVQGQVFCDDSRVQARALSAYASEGGKFEVPVRADGGFEFDAPSGDYTLRFSVHDGDAAVDVTLARAIRVQASEMTRVVSRLALRRLSVSIVDKETGASVPGAILGVSVGEHRIESYGLLKTDSLGVIDLYPCPVGEFKLSLQSETGGWKTIAQIPSSVPERLVIKIAGS